MSDHSQGPGWWLASDGLWYPPDQAVGAVDPVAPTQPVAPVMPTGPPLISPPPAPPYQPTSAQPYPPMSPSPYSTMPPPGGPPAKSGLGRGPIIGIALAAVAIIAAVAFLATRSDGNKQNASTSKAASSSSKSSSSKSSSSSSSSSASKSSSSETPAGFTTLTDDADGLSISVPSTFESVDASSVAGGIDSSQLSSLNPSLAPFVQGGEAFLDRVSLAAVDSSAGAGKFLVVGKSPTPIDPTDPNVASQLKDALDTTGFATNITADQIDLPAGPALRVELTLSLGGSAASGFDVGETLFFVEASGQTWVIVGASFPADTTGVFDDIAQTFKVSQ